MKHHSKLSNPKFLQIVQYLSALHTIEILGQIAGKNILQVDVTTTMIFHVMSSQKWLKQNIGSSDFYWSIACWGRGTAGKDGDFWQKEEMLSESPTSPVVLCHCLKTLPKHAKSPRACISTIFLCQKYPRKMLISESLSVMSKLGLYIVSWYMGYILHVSFILVIHITSNDTFLLKFMLFWSLFPSNLCTYEFFWSKTRQNILLIHIKYHFMCIMICIISHKINDIEP